MNCPEVRYANEHGTVTHISSNPIFAKRDVKRIWKGAYHVFTGLSQYSHCGRIHRDHPKYIFSTTPPDDAVLCRRCNWNMTYNFVENDRDEEMRKVQELRAGGSEQEAADASTLRCASPSCGQHDGEMLEPRPDR